MQTRLGKTRSTLLMVAGALLVLIGTFIIFAPAEFYATNNIEVGASVSLLNELKAPAGLLLAAGVFMLGAIFVRRHADSALALAALIYLSYAFSRAGSFALDGVPAAGLIQAAALEGVIGLACVTVLMLRRCPEGRAA